MIIIAGTVTVNPDKREEAIAAAEVMMAASQAEPGCHHYAFYAHLSRRDTFLIYELWQDDAALENHFQTPHMATFNAQMPGFVTGTNLKRYDVTAVTDL